MELQYVSRTDYRQLRCFKNWHELPDLKPEQYWLPEGGSGLLALSGVREMVDEIDIAYDIICVPCGTGATLAGIVNAVPSTVAVLGFAALKNAGFLRADVELLLSCSSKNWEINLDYHFGGFASVNEELMRFIKNFEEKHTIPLEPVYTGKMLYGLYDLIKKQQIKSGQRIIAVHTGGLQGKRGFSR
jgi:1-aminocyclopropane-1-carboxylate deaminase